MLLPAPQRTKIDDSDDVLFYAQPRFVTHVDSGFIAQLTQLYHDRLPSQGRIFDLMSSWVSHLPEEVEFAHVEGHGLNGAELAKNPRLDHYFVQNLNQEQTLPLADGDFDAVINCVSVQYLQYPEAVFTEVGRILKPGGIAIFSFSNRMFYQKAIAAWRDGTEGDRVELVKSYFRAVPSFGSPEVITRRSSAFGVMPWFGSGDPFYAVLARKI